MSSQGGNSWTVARSSVTADSWVGGGGCELLRSPDSLDCAMTTIPASNAGGIELGVGAMAVFTGGARGLAKMSSA